MKKELSNVQRADIHMTIWEFKLVVVTQIA